MDEIKINMIEKTDEGLVLKLPTTSVEQVKGLKESLDKKVDKVEGKQLSTNDYSTEEKNKLSKLNNYDDTNIKADIAKKADTSTVNTNLAKKVDKVSGKGLSTNDYDNTEKAEVAKIKNLATSETVAGIKSEVETLKTSKVDKVVGKGLSTNDYDNVEKAEVAKVKNKADTIYVDTELADKATVTDLTKKIDKTSITSDLAGTDESKVLSQKAGNSLENAIKKIDLSGKINKSSITNSYAGTSISNVLSQKGANDLFKALNSSGDDISFSKNDYFHMLKINNKYCILTVLNPIFIGITIIPYGFRPKSTITFYSSSKDRVTIYANGKFEGNTSDNTNVFSITYDC